MPNPQDFVALGFFVLATTLMAIGKGTQLIGKKTVYLAIPFIMKITIAGSHPTAADLVDILNKRFNPAYSFRLFGIGKEKTIMARQSTFVGLQIDFAEDTVNFQRTLPSAASSAYSFLMMTELIAILILPLLIVSHGFTKDPYKEMAREIGFFLKEQYPPAASK